MLAKTNESICVEELIKADEGLLNISETISNLKWASLVILDKARDATDHMDACHYMNNVEAIIIAMAYVSRVHKTISDYKSS